MPSLSVRVDPRSALGALIEAEERQLPYAVSLALNRTANDAQEAMRKALGTRFKLRREQWNLRGIKIDKQDRANKTTWRVVIRVAPETSYLDKFEAGGNKLPVGGSYLWEPNDKVFRGRIIGNGDPLRPKNLHLHRDPSGRVIGDQRTFLAKTNNSEVPYVVVQRMNAPHRGFTAGSMKRLNLDSVAVGIGPQQKGMRSLQAKKRADATRTLYKLRKRIPVPAKLEFEPTIRATVYSRFQARMGEAMTEAMRSAR